ncbi:MAG TPA: HAMP domain-containing sensor histidine kinase [Vicinamibacterales bacterium]|nr:HAMP domain-containing sensor histidine kinase [Vicinamibacterales bacterium]
MFYHRRRAFRWMRPYPPPWWPENEPWPPRPGIHLHDRWAAPRAFRRRAFAGVGVMFWAVIALLWFAGGSRSDAWTTRPGGSVILGIVGGGVAVVLVMLVGRTVSRIGAVMEAADRVAGGDYNVHVREIGPASVRALARSFNTMTDRMKSHDRLRRDLMADVAHELRTPLTVIQGKLEGLIDGVYPRDAEQLQQLLEETRVLSRLVEDLRTLALSESGALKLQREPADVAALARDAAAAFGPEAASRGIALSVDAPQEIAPLDVDPIRIREIVGNLVSNALRHTPRGGSVTVRAGDDRVRVEVAVRDTGSGMSAEDLAHAFDRFYKGASSRGSGLGLTIAKNLVTAHGGNIRAASEPGRGTTITFTLPRVGTL